MALLTSWARSSVCPARPRHGLTEIDRRRQTHQDRQTETDRLRQTDRDRQIDSDRPRQTIDIVRVLVRVSCETDRVTDRDQTRRDRQTETRLSPVNISSWLREHKLLVPGSASASCCRAGRVLMTHFSHVCQDVCLYAWMDVYVCMCA